MVFHIVVYLYYILILSGLYELLVAAQFCHVGVLLPKLLSVAYQSYFLLSFIFQPSLSNSGKVFSMKEELCAT